MVATKADRLRRDVLRLWKLGCEFDNIDPTEKFVVWSNDNPYQADYDRATLELAEHLHERKAG